MSLTIAPSYVANVCREISSRCDDLCDSARLLVYAHYGTRASRGKPAMRLSVPRIPTLYASSKERALS